MPDILVATQELHDQQTSPNRFVYTSGSWNLRKEANGCFASFKSIADTDPFSIVFHGTGAPVTTEALSDHGEFLKCLKAHKQPFNVFHGTELSREWVEFLLSDKSPWRQMNDTLISKDPDYINNAGFAFTSSPDLQLRYNFALAVRFPWELPKNYEVWRRLKDKIDPTLALFIAANFCVAPGSSINGKYSVEYPWSFLEESDYLTVGRFINCNPRLGNSTQGPNVRPLWETKPSLNAGKCKSVLDDFCLRDVELPEIVETLTGLAEEQKGSW